MQPALYLITSHFKLSGLDVAGDAETLLHLNSQGGHAGFCGHWNCNPRLWSLKRSIFVLLQVGVTGILLMGLLSQFVGLLDTAYCWLWFGVIHRFCAQVLTEKQQPASTHGREAFTILLFQASPSFPCWRSSVLSGVREQSYDVIYFAKVLAVFGGMVIASRYVVRSLFKFIASSGATELLTATALFIADGGIDFNGENRLSMALAFWQACF